MSHFLKKTTGNIIYEMWIAANIPDYNFCQKTRHFKFTNFIFLIYVILKITSHNLYDNFGKNEKLQAIQIYTLSLLLLNMEGRSKRIYEKDAVNNFLYVVFKTQNQHNAVKENGDKNMGEYEMKQLRYTLEYCIIMQQNWYVEISSNLLCTYKVNQAESRRS